MTRCPPRSGPKDVATRQLGVGRRLESGPERLWHGVAAGVQLRHACSLVYLRKVGARTA